jgi:putative oxidoreductase
MQMRLSAVGGVKGPRLTPRGQAEAGNHWFGALYPHARGVHGLAGIGKITGYANTLAYMAAYGAPGSLLPVVIALELGGGLTGLIRWCANRAAPLLAGITVIAAVVFHGNSAAQAQLSLFLKDFAIAGGLLLAAIAQSRKTTTK